jgi:hypothetical protein
MALDSIPDTDHTRVRQRQPVALSRALVKTQPTLSAPAKTCRKRRIPMVGISL